MSVDLAGVVIESQEKMKVLGVIFDNNLRWNAQVKQSVAMTNSKISVMRKFRSQYTMDQFSQKVTLQIFSSLYYCSSVWMTSNTLQPLWKLINSAHYKVIRILAGDFKGKINREKLDQWSKRASPKQGSKYAKASTVIKILKHRKPINLYNYLQETFYKERRKPGIGKFCNNSKGKIGHQKVGKNLFFMAAIQDDWYKRDLSDDQIRTLLKRTFFGYLTTVNPTMKGALNS